MNAIRTPYYKNAEILFSDMHLTLKLMVIITALL
jgi:hypothetical protein